MQDSEQVVATFANGKTHAWADVGYRRDKNSIKLIESFLAAGKYIASVWATTESAAQPNVLPKNLRNAVKHLSDGELDLMHAATVEEMRRRGRTPKEVQTRSGMAEKQSPPTEKRLRVDIAEITLTRGQVNAVRAAFKAGITPSRIARQFGISKSNVRKALASDEPT
jgi:hypothetical protein